MVAGAVSLVLGALLVRLTVPCARLAWGARWPSRRASTGRANLLIAAGLGFVGGAACAALLMPTPAVVLMILAAVIAVVGAIALMPLEVADAAT